MEAQRIRTPLEKVGLLDEESRAALKGIWITTVEQLVSVLETEPKVIGEILHLSAGDTKELTKKARSHVDPELLQAAEEQHDRVYSLGLLDPSLKRNRSST